MVDFLTENLDSIFLIASTIAAMTPTPVDDTLINRLKNVAKAWFLFNRKDK